MIPAALAAAGADHGSVPTILVGLAVVLAAAKLAGTLAERAGQPAVLGELVAGVLLGNLGLVGGPRLDTLAGDPTFVVLAELGAILLLFEVGLESTIAQMMAVGARAALVAVIGVVAPMLLGFGVGELTHSGQPAMFHAFLGAMLCATSVGITARVLADVGALRSRAARIILGAAVIDDVLGLVVLAVVSGAIAASEAGTTLGAGSVVLIFAKAAAFLVGALVVGSFLSPRVFRGALVLRSTGIVQALAVSFCFLFSWLALLAGLAPIVGAFAAGLVLEEGHFAEHAERGEPPLHDSLKALTGLFVPVFFVRMGMMVDVASFADPGVLGFAALLTVAAVAGKVVCGAAVPAGVSRAVVGLGMMPRGEVGLIFAGIGAQLVLGGRPIIDPATYAAAVFMVVATTMATPPLLVWALRRQPQA